MRRGPKRRATTSPQSRAQRSKKSSRSLRNSGRWPLSKRPRGPGGRGADITGPPMRQRGRPHQGFLPAASSPGQSFRQRLVATLSETTQRLLVVNQHCCQQEHLHKRVPLAVGQECQTNSLVVSFDLGQLAALPVRVNRPRGARPATEEGERSITPVEQEGAGHTADSSPFGVLDTPAPREAPARPHREQQRLVITLANLDYRPAPPA